jgi:hypothetical protein
MAARKKTKQKLKIAGSKVARTRVLVFFLVLWFCGQGFKTTCKESVMKIFKNICLASIPLQRKIKICLSCNPL